MNNLIPFATRRVYCLERRQARRPNLPLGPDTRLSRDLGLDFVDRVLLGICLEQRLSIDIPNAELGQWRTVADVLLTVGLCRLAASEAG